MFNNMLKLLYELCHYHSEVKYSNIQSVDKSLISEYNTVIICNYLILKYR
jgi:hypothetical protein